MTHKKYAVIGLIGVVSAFSAGSLESSASAATVAPTDLADVIVAAAACVGPNAVSSSAGSINEMLVDGNPVTWGDGKVFIHGGSTVTVNFTVAAGCSATKFGLAAYANPIATFDPTFQDVEKQTYLTSSVITKSAGQSATLTLTLPAIMDCHYQIDFFSGDVLPAFTSGNYYGSPEHRLISVVHVARPNCNEVLETTTTRPVTTTTSTSSTSTTALPVAPNEVSVTSTTAPAEVLGETIDATTTTAPAEVLAESLARTGGNETALIGAGAAFALIGGSFRVAASVLRRRRNTGGTRFR